MRRILMVAASAAALALLSGTAASAMGGSGIRAAADQLGLMQNVARVCREVCRDGFCRERCFNRPDYNYGERRVYRSYEYDDPPPRVYRRYERGPGVGVYGPGVGVYGPGVGIEVGPGW